MIVITGKHKMYKKSTRARTCCKHKKEVPLLINTIEDFPSINMRQRYRTTFDVNKYTPTTSDNTCKNKLTAVQLRLNTRAADRRDGFEESTCTWLTLGLGGGGTGNRCVIARRALGVGGARVTPGAAGRRGGFEKAGRAILALGLGSASCLNVFARRTLNFLGDGAGVGLGTALRC